MAPKGARIPAVGPPTGRERADNPAMLYKFKSKAAGDLIMLEANGQRVLEIIGKTSGAKGIILPGEMKAAQAALLAAVAVEEAERDALEAKARAEGKPLPLAEGVSLRMRTHPFVEMLRTCEAEGKDIVWGV